ncbi:hypothetical protein [Capnocytophaga gingivalis]
MPDSINSLGWAMYGSGFLSVFLLLLVTITLIYYSFKYRIVKIISIILGIGFVSTIFLFFRGADITENYKNGIYAIKMPHKYKYWYDYLWHINDDHFYSDMAPPKELEFDEQREYMFNSSSNIFFSSENKLITYHYNSLDNIIYFSKIDTKGTSKEKLTHSKTKNTEQRGVFLGDYYIDFDENYYHTWLVDDDTLKKPLEEVPHIKKWTPEQRKAFLSKVQKEATYYFLKHTDRKDYYDLKEFPEEGNYKVVFFLDGKWQLAQIYCQKEDFDTLEPARGTHPPFKQALMARFTAPPVYAPAKNLRPVYIHKSSTYSPNEEDRKNTNPQFDNKHIVEVYFDINQSGRMAYLKTTYLMPKDYLKFLHQPSTFLRKGDEEMEIFHKEALYRQKQWEYSIYFNGNDIYFIIERFANYY